MLDYGLADRTICVTGGASGIGRATVELLARQGARVAVIDLRQAEVERVAAEVVAAGGMATGRALDVRDADATAAALEQFEATLGPIEGLVACAGISGGAPAETLAQSEWDEVLSVNLTGLFITCQQVGRRMIGRGRGALVLIGSVDGLGGHAARSHYVASKFGVSGLTKNLALEWGRHGLRVNCIAPGFVDTPLLRRGVPPAFLDVVVDRTPLGRLASAEEVAAAALLLLSDAAGFVTGAILPVDGGVTTGFFTRKQGGDYSSARLLAAGLYSE